MSTALFLLFVVAACTAIAVLEVRHNRRVARRDAADQAWTRRHYGVEPGLRHDD